MIPSRIRSLSIFAGVSAKPLNVIGSPGEAEGRTILGRVAEVTAYNRSFPRMDEAVWLTQGYSGAPGAGRARQIPDLQSLFSHPSKEHGFLVAKTFFEPESVFRIAKANVLKHYVDHRLVAPSIPTFKRM